MNNGYIEIPDSMYEQYVKIPEVIVAYINALAVQIPVFVFLGLIYILLLEWKTVYKIYQNRKKLSDPSSLYQLSLPILKRLRYLIGGVALSYSGFLVIGWFSNSLESSKELAQFPYSERGGIILAIFGAAAVLAMQWTGIALILSAGGRFLVNTAKFIALFTVIILLTFLILARAQLI